MRRTHVSISYEVEDEKENQKTEADIIIPFSTGASISYSFFPLLLTFSGSVSLS